MRRGLVRVMSTLTLGALILGACDVSALGLRGSGNVVVEERDITGFDQIELRGSGTVFVELGSDPHLTVQTDDNLLEFVTSEVEGSTLVLDTSRQLSATNDIIYTVTAISLGGLSLTGSGLIDLAGASSESFELALDGSGQIDINDGEFVNVNTTFGGSGQITVSGTTSALDVRLSGSGTFDGSDLLAERADVRLSGSGEIIVNISDRLDAEVSGSGNVTYIGDPTVKAETTGSGSVRPR